MSRQYNLPLPSHEAMTADDFMVTASNREAVAWLLDRAPADWPSPAIILHGPRGCGKTHLLTVWSDGRGARRIEAGENLDDLIGGRTDVRAVALDDADRVAGKPALEEWLQHLYVTAANARIPLLLTAAQPPLAWNLSLKDIDSRLKSCLTIEIKEPDDELMRGLLLKLFSDRQLRVETDVIDYLAPRLERTGSAVREAVIRLDQRALEQKRRITIPFVQEVGVGG